MEYECDDCGLRASDLEDYIEEPELIFETTEEGTFCQGCYWSGGYGDAFL